MPGVQLRAFLFLSVLLHIIALFIVAVIFQPEGIITKPQLVQIGVMGKYKDLGVGSGNFVELPPKEIPKPEKKEAQKLEKKVVKGFAKKKQEIETSKKKEIVSRVNESVIVQSTNQSDKNNESEGEQINEIASATMAGTGTSKEGKGIDVEGSGRSVELGYPGYKINPKPQYPIIARRNGYEGVVLLRVRVLESGKVGSIELEKSSGYEILDKAAIEAVKDWIFIPGKKDGVPISSWVTIPIRFELSG